MISIKEIVWTNFLGYGNYANKVCFDDLKGVCLIEGEHDENEFRDEGDEKLNGAGKSSIIEAITWCLFGNLTRKQNPGDAVINWNTGKNCQVSIKTHDGYEITRMRKYNGLTEVLIYKDGEDKTKSTSRPAQDYINDIFKINYNTFIRSRIFGQFSIGFLEDTEAKRRRVFEHAMRIDNLIPMVEATKDKMKGVDKDLIEIDSKVNGLSSELEHIRSHMDSLNKKSSNFSEEISKEISEIKSELTSEILILNKRIIEIEENIESKKSETREAIDIESLQLRWNEYNDNLELYNKKLDRTNKITQKLSELQSDLRLKKQLLLNYDEAKLIDISGCEHAQEIHDIAISQRNSVISLRDNLNLAIERTKTKMQHEEKFIHDDHEAGSVCSKCRNKISGEQLNKEIKESEQKIQKFKDDIKKSENALLNANAELSKLNDDISIKFMSVEEAVKINNKIKSDEESVNIINKDIDTLNDNIKKLSSVIVEIDKPSKPVISISEATTNNEYVKNIDKSISEDKQRIQNIKKEASDKTEKAKKLILTSKNKENPYDSLIKEQTRLIRDLEEAKQNQIKSQNEKKTLKDHLNYIRESYSNKKKIKAFWINELIPDFNKYLRYYLDFFEIDDKIEFDELLTPKMDRWPYDTHSGGECKRIDLSIMFALSDLQVSNFGSQSNFIVLDEVDGRLDPFTINKLTSLLSDDLMNRNDGLTNILVISHRKEMKDRFPHKIKVKNKQGNSYIINNG